MNKAIEKQLALLEKQEQKLLCRKPKEPGLTRQLAEKIPPTLHETLNQAFIKAFRLIFLKGASLIEKTYQKEELTFDFDVSNYAVERRTNRKTLRRLDRSAKRSGRVNHTLGIASGAGLGLLGIGLPDIPIFLGVLLRGLYETALSYGFSYESDAERIYLLRLIRTALAEGAVRAEASAELDSAAEGTLEEEIAKTAAVLADAMLVSKFLQGIPLVGVVGGVANHTVDHRVAQLARIKYKQRYLRAKLG